MWFPGACLGVAWRHTKAFIWDGVTVATVMIARVSWFSQGRSASSMPARLSVSLKVMPGAPPPLSACYMHTRTRTLSVYVEGWQSNSELFESRLRWKKSITVGKCSPRFGTEQMLAAERAAHWLKHVTKDAVINSSGGDPKTHFSRT